MAASTRRPRKSSAKFFVHKPHGQIHQRVQAVGPEHFGIVCVDCAKLRSKYILCDFFGNVLIPPTVASHVQADLQSNITRIRQAMEQHELLDVLIAIEQTGTYHRPVQDAFRGAGWETRLVHPFASHQFRQPANPANKTDDTDLAAIFRATVNGFGLLEAVWPDDYLQLQLYARHRRDLVRKQAKLRCQILAQLHGLMPGFADSFCDVFQYAAALVVAARTCSAAAIRDLGRSGLEQLIREGGARCMPTTVNKILAWAQTAVAPQTPIEPRRRILNNLEDDRHAKIAQILGLERELAHRLARTPYILLMAIPGLNVVSVAELAGELGPITNYANANRITGRAGLHPSRYQSDTVDRANGPIRRCSNRRLRQALIQIADNLVNNNHHFNVRALTYRQQHKDPRWIRVKVAKSFTRLAFAMLSSRTLFPHPCCQQRHYILDKLIAFHRTADTPMSLVMQDLDAATSQLPRSSYAEEAAPLHERLRILHGRRRGPQPLEEILPIVLARLGIGVIPSTASKEQDPG